MRLSRTRELQAFLMSLQRPSTQHGTSEYEMLPPFGLPRLSDEKSVSLITTKQLAQTLGITFARFKVDHISMRAISYPTTRKLKSWERAKAAWKFWKALD